MSRNVEWLGWGGPLPPLAATAAHDLIGATGVWVSSRSRRAWISWWSFSFWSRRTFWSCLTSKISALVDSITVVWCVIISFKLLMSCRISLVVTRPLLSSVYANSGFERAMVVTSSPWRGLLLFRGTIAGSKFSSVKISAPRWVFVGEGSGPPAGGSAIGPGLVPARYTTATVLYKDSINHHFFAVG